MLLRLLSAGADSVDVTLSVGIRLTGDPDEGELALLSPHMDGSETAQVWQLTVELGAEAKMAGSAFGQVEGFAITGAGRYLCHPSDHWAELQWKDSSGALHSRRHGQGCLILGGRGQRGGHHSCQGVLTLHHSQQASRRHKPQRRKLRRWRRSHALHASL
ncbi:MAG: hypothetical protein ACLUEU_01195 [Oscillospiraceae bacterium]